MALVRGLVLLLSGLGLAACGVGEGNRIVSLSVVNGDNGGAPPTVSYQCLRQSLGLYATFSTGAQGDYTSRATWSSSNPAAVRVSNGDIFVGDNSGLVYRKGTLIPDPNAADGTQVTITAEYVGLTASTVVAVKTPGKITFTPADATIAPESFQALQLTTDLDGTGIITDVTQYATLSLPNDTAGTYGKLSGSTVTAVAATPDQGPLQVQAKFDACPSSLVTTTLTVAPIQTLELIQEADNDSRLNAQFTDAANQGKLLYGTSEATKVLAHFANGATQDLSLQATYSATDPNDATKPSALVGFNGLLTSRNILVAPVVSGGTGGTANLAASFGTATPPATPATSNSLTVTVIPGTLAQVGLRDDDKPGVTISPRGTHQFHAMGSFAAADGSGTIIAKQDITRHVLWSSTDEATAFVSNNFPTAGLAASLKTDPGCAYITGAFVAASGTTAVPPNPGKESTLLTIGTPASCTATPPAP